MSDFMYDFTGVDLFNPCIRNFPPVTPDPHEAGEHDIQAVGQSERRELGKVASSGLFDDARHHGMSDPLMDGMGF